MRFIATTHKPAPSPNRNRRNIGPAFRIAPGFGNRRGLVLQVDNRWTIWR